MSAQDFTTENIRPKVLIVDDREENLVALERVLKDMEIDLFKATSGNEALALTLEHEFALALVDIQMPGMDGYETVELMHKDVSPEMLPVIFVSAVYSGEFHKIRGVEVGAVDFIEKPLVPSVLRGKVKIFLNLYKNRKIQENFNEFLVHEVEERTAVLNETYEKLISETKERLELEQRMLQTQKMEAIGTMAGGIAHDFNNILAIIQLNASVLLDELLPGEQGDEMKEGLREIIHAGLRGKDLTEKILSFCRMDSHKKDTSDSVSIRDAVQGAVDMVRHILPATVRLDVQLEESYGLINSSQIDIYQIILNLCVNAKDAMNENGTLQITLHEEDLEAGQGITSLNIVEGRYVKLSVADNGSGIDANDLSRIFDPFYTTKDIGKGTGMGLSVIHGLVTDLQGAIKVESETGKGTTFHVYLPLSGHQSLETEQKEIPPDVNGVESILFVDDEIVLASLGERILTNKGYKVVRCTSSVEALKTFARSPGNFDFIVTDNYMPDMDGVDFASEVLKIRDDIPIMLCTGYSSKVTESNFDDYGFCQILMKPYRPLELLEAVRGNLDCLNLSTTTQPPPV